MIKYLTSCPGCISQSVHRSVIFNAQNGKKGIEYVQRRVFVQIDQK